MQSGIAILAVLSVCSAARVPHRTNTASIEVSYPEPITMDRFEAMLQQASKILRTPAQVVEPTGDTNDHIHHSHSQRDQQDSYYLPIYHGDKSHRLDAKSRQLQQMLPPSELEQAANFFIIKQKKVPKKFLNAAKHINVKVIPDGDSADLPLQTQGYSKEHNIIFDDTFFGVDAQPAVPDDVPQEHSVNHGYIAPIYSRRLQKTDDMFATSASKREARMRLGMPMRYVVSY